MYNLNKMGLGLNKPLCNTRQYGSSCSNLGFKDTKPEYPAGNDHFKLINSFGFQTQHLITDKKFADITSAKTQPHSAFPTNYKVSPPRTNIDMVIPLPAPAAQPAKNKVARKSKRKRKHAKNNKALLKLEVMEDAEVCVLQTPLETVDVPQVVVEQRSCRSFRIPSECESEDSFIVFDSSAPNGFENEILELEEIGIESSSDEDVCSMVSSMDDVWPAKRVRFADDKDLCEVHPMVQWSFAYQKARKGPWEQYALDRTRFRRRIDDLETILGTVLQPEHRNRIYNERFV